MGHIFDPRKYMLQVNVGVEVGVHKGSLARELLKTCPDLFLFMVDHWFLHGEEPDEYAKRQGHGGRRNYEVATVATSEFYERRCILPMSSSTAANLFRASLFDFVYLDADHREGPTYSALCEWWPKVRPGGVIAGHDHKTLTQGWGVEAAVDGFVGIHQLEVSQIPYNSFLIRKK